MLFKYKLSWHTILALCLSVVFLLVSANIGQAMLQIGTTVLQSFGLNKIVLSVKDLPVFHRGLLLSDALALKKSTNVSKLAVIKSRYISISTTNKTVDAVALKLISRDYFMINRYHLIAGYQLPQKAFKTCRPFALIDTQLQKRIHWYAGQPIWFKGMLLHVTGIVSFNSIGSSPGTLWLPWCSLLGTGTSIYVDQIELLLRSNKYKKLVIQQLQHRLGLPSINDIEEQNFNGAVALIQHYQNSFLHFLYFISLSSFLTAVFGLSIYIFALIKQNEKKNFIRSTLGEKVRAQIIGYIRIALVYFLYSYILGSIISFVIIRWINSLQIKIQSLANMILHISFSPSLLLYSFISGAIIIAATVYVISHRKLNQLPIHILK
ncbi:MAG: ABC transporter permease [Psychromonas sp.]|nr:ABC transporter permease [Psychromonas sp.]